MARLRSKYVCQQCGYTQVSWAGKCPECNAWASLVETVVEETSSRSSSRNSHRNIISANPVRLSKVLLKTTSRISTKISEFDRVLGGGLVPGQVVLLAGEPGVGKSTLLLELSDKLENVLYVAGEESAG